VRRPRPLYLLIPAVLAATGGLTYYSVQLQASRAQVVEDTLRELAEEKVIGIESAILDAETKLFSDIEYDNLQEIPARMAELPITSVLVLDERFQIIPGGNHTKLPQRDWFLDLFTTRVLPDLNLAQAQVTQPRHLHAVYGTHHVLFAAVRRFQRGRSFFVVAEYDTGHLFSTIFPQFFDVQSRSLYQVVDEHGGHRYGRTWADIPENEVVEVPFREVLSPWKLRVVREDAPRLARELSRQVTGQFVLIGLATMVIICALAGLFVVLRRERRLNDLKSEFISNVSHELKTPLSIISMFGELLSLGRVKSPEQGRQYAEIVRRESIRLTRLIDNVLDFAKIERGADVYEFCDGENLAEVVSTALDISKPGLEGAQLALEVEVADFIPSARMDRNAMTLAVLNLVDNAIKYASDGKRLCIRVGPRQEGIAVEVQDFGPGIAEAERDQIFERFYRAQAARRTAIRGSGIGLALVKHIAEAHGGWISVDTELGKGCTFRLWIPAEERS
jgi:two-component system phosphate regulon sensor histidine kinase PhoR